MSENSAALKEARKVIGGLQSFSTAFVHDRYIKGGAISDLEHSVFTQEIKSVVDAFNKQYPEQPVTQL